MSSKFKILLTSSNAPESGVNLLQKKFDVKILESNISDSDIAKIAKDYDALMIIKHVKIDAKFLDTAGSKLKIISTMSAGYDHLDVPEIKKRGIKIGYTPQVLSGAVAEIAVLLALSAARRAHEGRLMMQEGIETKKYESLLGHELINSTVGIVGLGNIGIEILKRLQPFGINKFIYNSRSKNESDKELGAEFVNFNELLHQSDFIFVSVPLLKETTGMFNDDAFSKMKKNCVFVNVSRGKIVKTDALVRALKNGTIFAAGLDVTDPEPLPTDHELLKLKNAVLIPHLGSATYETRSKMSLTAAQNIVNGLEGKSLIYEL